MAFLDSKVSGQAAAATDRRHGRSRRREQGGISLPADHRSVVAMWLDDQR
jgi:hypothetical protein